MSVEPFPYLLLRWGGRSYSDLCKFNSPGKLNKEVQRIYDLYQKILRLKVEFCDELFEIIKNEDQDTQNLLQNFRRDLYNDRHLKSTEIDEIKNLVPPRLEGLLNTLLSEKEEIGRRIDFFEKLHKDEVSQLRLQLKKIISNTEFVNGLVLSSNSLLKRLSYYSSTAVEDFRKKEFQTEFSILQYITRMYFKTSPYSTFTNLSVGHLIPNGESLKIEKTAVNEVSSHVRLNNSLLSYLKGLIRNYREAVLFLPVICNVTIRREEDHFLFLTNNSNVESFQRIQINPVLELVHNILTNSHDDLSYSCLADKLNSEIASSRREIESYIDQLVDFGFLELNFGVSGMDPNWAITLNNKFKKIFKADVPLITELQETINHLNAKCKIYENLGTSKRQVVLQEIYDQFRGITWKIHEAAKLPADERQTVEQLQNQWQQKKKNESEKKNETKKSTDSDQQPVSEEKTVFKHKSNTFFSFRPEQLIFEDTIREVSTTVNRDSLKKIMVNIETLMGYVEPFDSFQIEKDQMLNFFKKKYQSQKVRLMSFYEDYYREFKIVGDLEKTKKSTETINEKFKKKWDSTFEKSIAKTIKRSPEVNLKPSHFRDVETLISKSKKSKKRFSGAFIQFSNSESGLKAVLNSTFPGHGKMMSRFLHIFNKNVTEEIRSWNRQYYDKGFLLAEACDASYFNANLHPTLMPYEISIPGGQNTLSKEKQIAITDIDVVIRNKELILQHRVNGKRILVFDLGFQGSIGRSQLFQLITKFNEFQYLTAYPITSVINKIYYSKFSHKKEKSDSIIAVSPRITFGEVVIQRKSWIVPKDALPNRKSLNSDSLYFYKLNEWRMNNNIPHDVFIYVNPFRGQKLDRELSKNLTKDDYKPQYINFTNPLMVRMFEKLSRRAPGKMRVVEMLPNTKEMLDIEGKPYVHECVIQWISKNDN